MSFDGFVCHVSLLLQETVNRYFRVEFLDNVMCSLFVFHVLCCVLGKWGPLRLPGGRRAANGHASRKETRTRG